MIDDIHSRKPVNKTAALAVSKGFHYIPNKKIQTADSELPIETKKINKVELNKTFIDYTGMTFGRFTVIGRAKNHKGWVVKCNCGIYSIRRSKAILNINNVQDRCEVCRHKAYLKRINHFKEYGFNKDIKEY